MKWQGFISQLLLATVSIAMCGIPEFAQAQSALLPQQQAAPATSQSAPAGQQQNGTVDPSRAPLNPVPSSTPGMPEAPSSSRGPAAQPRAAQQPAPQQPAGAAAAQAGVTSGGPASKPAGNAIAPAKQRQVRSFLIKLGAVAAAGIAIGTVVALSKGSSSKPPGVR